MAGFAERGAALARFRISAGEDGSKINRRRGFAAASAFSRIFDRVLREGMRAFGLMTAAMMAAAQRSRQLRQTEEQQQRNQ